MNPLSAIRTGIDAFRGITRAKTTTQPTTESNGSTVSCTEETIRQRKFGRRSVFQQVELRYSSESRTPSTAANGSRLYYAPPVARLKSAQIALKNGLRIERGEALQKISIVQPGGCTAWVDNVSISKIPGRQLDSYNFLRSEGNLMLTRTEIRDVRVAMYPFVVHTYQEIKPDGSTSLLRSEDGVKTFAVNVDPDGKPSAVNYLDHTRTIPVNVAVLADGSYQPEGLKTPILPIVQHKDIVATGT